MEIVERLQATGIDLDASERRLQEYSYDASNYRVRPIAVAFPRDVQECRDVLRVCSELRVPVTVRGGGTSMAGNAVGAGVIIDISRRIHSVGAIDAESNSVWVDAGVVLGELRTQVERESAGRLTFAPDPSSLTRATIGGSIGNDACGNHSVAYGRMSHHVHEIELLTIDGAHMLASGDGLRAVDAQDQHSARRAEDLSDTLEELARTNLLLLRLELQSIPRQVSGYHLGNLLPENGLNIARALAGSEGTCAIVVAARVALVTKPGPPALLCVGYDSTVESARDIVTMLGAKPSAIEGLDSSIVELMRRRRGAESVNSLPAGNAYVMIEFSAATIEAASERCTDLLRRLHENGRVRASTVVTDAAERAKLWKVREDGAGLSSRRLDGEQTWPGWEDSAVAPENVADYLEELLPLIERYGYSAAMYGHFGAGCVHMRINFELRTEAGRATFARFMRDAAQIVVAHGGSLSGEHGDGRARSELLGLMYSPEMLAIFAEFKHAWDPNNLLNPGIIVDPQPFVEGLSLEGLPVPAAEDASKELAPNTPASWTPATGNAAIVIGQLERPEYHLGTFVGNAHACIGVGRCRATTGSFMCPSYRATKDEKDSTRGRARVLQELARGKKTSSGGWAEPEVREALDFCLSCKACSSDCPTGVDIAEAKSELINDHYRGRLRPFTHYSIGWLPRWLPLLSRVSGAANWGSRLKPFRWLGDKLGVSARRRLPAFAPHHDIRRRVAEANFAQNGDVLIFADSFTKAFRPDVIPAAARVLVSTGVTVGCTPDACCGLTWISTGQRDGAARRLENLVKKFDDGTERDIVVLEPSCAAAIRDDGPKLVPGAAAKRVAARVRSFAVAVDSAMASGWRPDAPAPVDAVLQTHCHEHAVFGSGAQRRVLERWGVAKVHESSSCCGVAGNFGFESEHFDMSMRVAEHSILPVLEQSRQDTLVLTDGFSCSMQVSQIDSMRQSVHLASALDSE